MLGAVGRRDSPLVKAQDHSSHASPHDFNGVGKRPWYRGGRSLLEEHLRLEPELLDSTDDLVLNRESTLVELVGILEADEHASFEGALSGLGLVWVGYGSVTFGAKLY